MPGELLLDTGPFVALVDRSETQHGACVVTLERWTAPIITTEPVLTEVLHIVGPGWQRQKRCLDFLLRGAFLLIPSSKSSVQRAAALMEKYQGVPMDYADATLVALAEDARTDQVFTLDRRGFMTYRLHGRTPFRLQP